MKKFIFVLMPFNQEFDDIYKLGIKSACEIENAYCERVDEQFYEGSMLDRIYNQINNADYLVADTTNKNPNVFYEIGYAHALEKKVILITQDGGDIPFDMKHFAHILYSKDKISLLKDNIQKKLKWYLQNENDDKMDIIPDVYLNGSKLRIEDQNNITVKLGLHQFNEKVSYSASLNIAVNNPSEEYAAIFLQHMSVRLPGDFNINNHTVKKVPGNIQVFDIRFDEPMYPLEWRSEEIIIECDFKYAPEPSYNGIALMHMSNHTIIKFNFTLSFLGDFYNIPNKVTLLEMYGVSAIEQMNIEKRWQDNKPYNALAVPLGMKGANNVVYLDSHEKAHGPHGLVVGTTGSGKSETLQTYIISLAINFHPHEVSFLLIDYKGGGMANYFAGLPHLVGTITNLEGKQIRRSLVALKSELKRRQRILADINVNHIDRYQQLYRDKIVDIPLPHLMIIAEEFAELKSQQPDFMHDLVSVARIGRSLGVHLILATQKPAGVVDDQIWSNSKFKLAHKVLDKHDSIEVIKTSDAASITQIGRAYLQVGNNEIYELFQVAWSGAIYNTNQINESINTISNNLYGQSQSIDITQLKAVKVYICNLFNRMNTKKVQDLWLPPLTEIVSWEDADKRKGGFNGDKWLPVDHWLCPVLGLYDDPLAQRQDSFCINIGKEGHMALYGAPGTGKTTFLQTLVYGLVHNYSPEFVNLYIFDFGGRTMEYMDVLPHVGNVILPEDEEKLVLLFKLLIKELNVRKKLFAEYGVGNLHSYMEISERILPCIIMIFDNYEAFSENYPDYETEMIKISRDGGSYGIYQILIGYSPNSIKNRIISNYKLTYTLQLNNKYDYIDVVGKTEGLEPEAIKGRGLAKLDYVVEFQTAVAKGIANEAERLEKINEIFERMSVCWDGPRAKSVQCIPENMKLDNIINNREYIEIIKQKRLPIGYDIEEANLQTIGVQDQFIFTIIGGAKTGKTDFMRSLLQLMKTYDWELYVFEKVDGALVTLCKMNELSAYANNQETLDNFTTKLCDELVARHKICKTAENEEKDLQSTIASFRQIVILIDDYELFYCLLSEKSYDLMKQILRGASGLGATFFISANNKYITRYSSDILYKYIFSGETGLLLGGELNEQTIYKLNIPYSQQNIIHPLGQGYLVQRSSYKIVKFQYF